MNYNEFEFCCIMFTKTFEGSRYGNIVKDCYTEDIKLIISVDDICFNPFGIFGYTKNNSIFELRDLIGLKIYTKGINIVKFYTTKEFLEYFNIPLEDIV